MRNEFSTFEVIKFFKPLKRDRLQEWLAGRSGGGQPFFVPTKFADGQGTRAVFSREDLYRLRLFIILLDVGFSRSDARDTVDMDFSNVGSGKGQIQWGLISRKKEKGGFVAGVMKFFESWEKMQGYIRENKYPVNTIIDLQAIKNEVDGLVEE